MKGWVNPARIWTYHSREPNYCKCGAYITKAFPPALITSQRVLFDPRRLCSTCDTDKVFNKVSVSGVYHYSYYSRFKRAGQGWEHCAVTKITVAALWIASQLQSLFSFCYTSEKLSKRRAELNCVCLHRVAPLIACLLEGGFISCTSATG